MKASDILVVVIFAACFGFAGGIGGFLLLAHADLIDGIVPRPASQDVRWLSTREALITTTTYLYGTPMTCTQYINTQRRVSTLAC